MGWLKPPPGGQLSQGLKPLALSQLPEPTPPSAKSQDRTFGKGLALPLPDPVPWKQGDLAMGVSLAPFLPGPIWAGKWGRSWPWETCQAANNCALAPHHWHKYQSAAGQRGPAADTVTAEPAEDMGWRRQSVSKCAGEGRVHDTPARARLHRRRTFQEGEKQRVWPCVCDYANKETPGFKLLVYHLATEWL